jgi:hypothetical protein
MKKLPKGTIIRIGQNKRKSISMDAIGMDFELPRDLAWDDHANMATIVRKPKGCGWLGSVVSHRLDPYGDRIISIPSSSNKEAARLLDKEW